MNKILLAVGTMVVALSVLSGCSEDRLTKPTAKEAETALSQYLRSENAAKNEAAITGPANIRVGSYEPQLEGWPVYADYKVSYKENGIEMNYTGSSSTPAAYAKKSGSTTVCFKPKMFADLEAQMEKEMNKMMKEFAF